MQTSIPGVQGISNESEATKHLYGLDQKISENFGTQCLIARRFLEQGVRFVQVTHSALKAQWDQHGNLRRDHAERAAQVDQSIAGLLTDLKQRGMLDDTLVVWAGEFGRTQRFRDQSLTAVIIILMVSPPGWLVPEFDRDLNMVQRMSLVIMPRKTLSMFMIFTLQCLHFLGLITKN